MSNFNLTITQVYILTQDSNGDVTDTAVNSSSTWTLNTNNTTAATYTINPSTATPYVTYTQNVNTMANSQVPQPSPINGNDYMWDYFYISTAGIYAFSVTTAVPFYITILSSSGLTGQGWDSNSNNSWAPGGGGSGTSYSFQITPTSSTKPVQFNIKLQGYETNCFIQKYQNSSSATPSANPGTNCSGSSTVIGGNQGGSGSSGYSGNGSNGITVYNVISDIPITITGGTISNWYNIAGGGGGGGTGYQTGDITFLYSGNGGESGDNTTSPFQPPIKGDNGTIESGQNGGGCPGQLVVPFYDNNQKTTFGGFGGCEPDNNLWFMGGTAEMMVYLKRSVSS
jgi:hypothetical protein